MLNGLPSATAARRRDLMRKKENPAAPSGANGEGNGRGGTSHYASMGAETQYLDLTNWQPARVIRRILERLRPEDPQ